MPSCAGVSFVVNRSRLSPLSFARVFDQFGFGLRWTFIGRSALGHGEKNSRRAYVFRFAYDSCPRRVVPALTFSATTGLSATGQLRNQRISAGEQRKGHSEAERFGVPHFLATQYLRTKGIKLQFPNGVVSSVSFVSTTNTARSLAGSVSLALALTLWPCDRTSFVSTRCRPVLSGRTSCRPRHSSMA
jgi:hypothetical protein